MRVLQVGIRQRHIPLQHVQGLMAQHPLQAKHVAAVPQVLNGGGVAEAMRMYVRHPGAFAQLAEESAYPGNKVGKRSGA